MFSNKKKERRLIEVLSKTLNTLKYFKDRFYWLQTINSVRNELCWVLYEIVNLQEQLLYDQHQDWSIDPHEHDIKFNQIRELWLEYTRINGYLQNLQNDDTAADLPDTIIKKETST